MPGGTVVIHDDLVLRIGANRTPLSPSQAFALAQRLIRVATRVIVIEEVADSAEILAVISADRPVN